MDLVGLARTPRRISAPLSALASSTAAAAAELPTMLRDRRDRAAMDAALAETRELWQRLMMETGHMLGGGLDRGDVLAIGLALKTLADRLDEAAAAVPPVGTGSDAWVAVAGVSRDSAREVAAAVAHLDGPSRARDPRLDRLESLDAEGRRLAREGRARALSCAPDTAAALVADDFLQRLERILAASRDAGRTIRLVVIKHA